jgi:hypothetical protein
MASRLRYRSSLKPDSIGNKTANYSSTAASKPWKSCVIWTIAALVTAGLFLAIFLPLYLTRPVTEVRQETTTTTFEPTTLAPTTVPPLIVSSAAIDEFARLLTTWDFVGLTSLFDDHGTVALQSAMPFLSGAVLKSVSAWIEQMQVHQSQIVSHHLTLSNCNVSTCIGYYTYTLDAPGLPMVVGSFTVRFNVSDDLILAVESFSNATSSLVWSVFSVPEELVRKRQLPKTPPQGNWNLLQTQIESLIEAGQQQTALLHCQTPNYQELRQQFDPFGQASVPCNLLAGNKLELTVPFTCPSTGGFVGTECLNLTELHQLFGENSDSLIFPDRIKTINSIHPYPSTPIAANSLDFTITGDSGIQISGGMHGLTISNLGVLHVGLSAPVDEFEVTTDLVSQAGTLTFVKKPQAPHAVWAGPGPSFRLLTEADLPNISTALLYGILDPLLGGTGSAQELQGCRAMVSSCNPLGASSIIEGPLLETGQVLMGAATGPLAGNIVGGRGIAITIVENVLTIYETDYDEVIEVNLAVPADLFVVDSLPVTHNGSLSFAVQTQLGNQFWAGPVNGSMGIPNFRYIDVADLPLIPLSDNLFTGILPVSHGGTGSDAVLMGNRIIISNGEQSLLESPPLEAGQFLLMTNDSVLAAGSLVAGTGMEVNLVNSSLVVSAIPTVIQVELQVPSTLFAVTSGIVTYNGSLAFEVIPQEARTLWISGNETGLPSFRLLEEADLPSINLGNSVHGTLPVSRGGTGSTTDLNGNRLLVSLPDQRIVESSIVATGGVSISIINSVITLDNSPAATYQLLTVTDSTWLGTNTSCVAPLNPSCYDISGQTCPTAPLSGNCLPADAIFNSITVNSLTLLNTSFLLNTNIASQEVLGVGSLQADTFYLNSSMTCNTMNGVYEISQDCFSIGGKTCPSGVPVSESCIPASLTFVNAIVNQNLTVNDVICAGNAMPANCIPDRISTINGHGPVSGTLDWTIGAGTGIAVLDYPHGLTIENTGVTSVGLSVPAAEFIVTGSGTVNTTGYLAFSKATQLKNTLWAGPVSGAATQPSFRALNLLDLPPTGNGHLYIGTGTAVTAATLTAGTGISIANGAGSVTIANTGVTSVGLSLPISIFNVTASPITATGSLTASLAVQAANKIWAGPVSGGSVVPTFRSLVEADMPALALGRLLMGTGTKGYLHFCESAKR